MGADHRPNTAKPHFRYIGIFGQDHITQGFGIFSAIAIANGHDLPFRMNHSLFHLFHKGLQDLFAAPLLAEGHQAAIPAHGHDRLNIQHIAEKGGGGGATPALFQVFQLINGLDKVPL